MSKGSDKGLIFSQKYNNLFKKKINIIYDLRFLNKYFFKKNLFKHKIIDYHFEKINPNEFKKSNLKFKKYIIKPLDQSGSRGVFQFSKTNFKYFTNKAKKFSNNKNFLIEKFIDTNFQICLNGIFYNKKIYIFMGENYNYLHTNTPFVEIFPIRKINYKYEDQIKNKLLDFFTLNKYLNCVFNADIIIDKNNNINIIEITPRLGGNEMSKLTNLCYKIILIKSY